VHQTRFQYLIFVWIVALIVVNQVYAQTTDDHGNNCQTGTVVDLTTLTTSTKVDIPSVLTENDLDFFVIQVPEPNARVIITTRGGVDTSARLTDATSILIEENSNNGGDGSFLISQFLNAGTYCLQVSGGSANVTGNYALSVDADVPSDDHGNSCETASNVGKTDITGELSVFGDIDYFKIQIPEPGSEITFTTLADGVLFTFGTLFDQDNILITENNNNGGEGQFLIQQALMPGIYCLAISADDLLRTESVGAYTLLITGTFTPAGSCSIEHASISATSLDFAQVVTGNLSVPQLITVTNISTAPLHTLNIDSSLIAGTNAADFGVLNDTCAGSNLAEGDSCTVKGIFAPLTEGVKEAELLIPCNDLDSSPLRISLIGDAAVSTP
jgi:hypothetical protein